MKELCILLLAVFPLCLTSCNSQEKRDEISKSENQGKSIMLSFYPTGGVEDLRYSISVVGDSLIVKNHRPTSTNDQREYVALLSDSQIDEIDSLASAIKVKYRNTDVLNDTWGVTLEIDNQVVYETSDFSFGLPPNEAMNLINYLVGLSAIKIDLYGFS